MIIHVVPEKWYKEYIHAGEKRPVYQCPDSPFWKNGNFINIRNARSIDPYRGIPLDGDDILSMTLLGTKLASDILPEPIKTDVNTAVEKVLTGNKSALLSGKNLHIKSPNKSGC